MYPFSVEFASTTHISGTKDVSIALHVQGVWLAANAPNRCENIAHIQKFAATVIRFTPWAVFAGLRTYALTSKNVLLTASVFILALAPILPNLYVDSLEWVVSNGPLLGCRYGYTPNPTTLQLRYLCHESVIYASRGAMIASEAIVSVITWKKTYKYSRTAMLVGEKESLPEILLRNGVELHESSGIQCFM
ncbi:hypothetical protein C8Q74DRAFT_1215965 [Fomes fomentarius]|nr:hypothetical protein C8Q74DRAFT_1215965 [Fomes fomentarius]